jgi:crotonobetainyl-CoA:carnitine CoA-transferase CaiB-like acyl-CoA transferase
MTADRPRPLAGIVVADCSTVLAGPYCTMLLADLGADVVKVEPPEGDATRAWGPPWVGSSEDGTRTAAYYLAVNRNKRSIRIDLRQPAGLAVLRRLLARSDAFVENFRAGSLARLGLDDDALRELNPDLVHLAITGYGPAGPDADRPGYDFVVQAEAGLMSITGQPDEEGGRPTKVGVAISDVVTGIFGAVAVLGGLLGRERRHGRDGEKVPTAARIDISLLESTLAVLINQAQNAFATGTSPGRRGNAHPNIVPYESFETSDGEIAVSVGSERQWPRFCDAVGLPELAADGRYATNADRVTARAALRPVLAARFRERTAAEWLAALRTAEVPCGPINDILTAFDSPQAVSLGVRTTVSHPALGEIPQVRSPFTFSDVPAETATAPPLLGEHSDEILEWLGYRPAEIAALRHDRIV